MPYASDLNTTFKKGYSTNTIQSPYSYFIFVHIIFLVIDRNRFTNPRVLGRWGLSANRKLLAPPREVKLCEIWK